MDTLFGLLPDTEWFQVRGIPFCALCTLHLLSRPEIKNRFPVTDNHGEAQAYFAFYHLSHGRLPI